jgi:rod shape-determining protein MreD
MVRPALSGTIGFFGGLFLGALSGATIAHYIITRTILGYVIGLSTDLEPNPRTIALMTAAGTFLNQLIMMFIAPPPNLGAFLQVTIIQALLNGVLAYPLSAGLRKVFRPKVV